MSFFLLGRLAGNDLRLLSADSFDTRAQAMAELQRLTADASFTEWDAEVFVVDLNAATPVLLVRPTTEPAEVAGPEQLADDHEPATETDGESFGVDAEDAEDAFAVAAAPVDQAEAVPVDVDLTLPEEPVVAEAEEFGAVEEPAQEPVDAAFADAALADAGAEIDAEAPDSLKDALRRATEDLESEGIVAPESIGPAEEVAEEEAAEPAEPAEEVAEEEAAEPAEPSEESATEPEPVAWPWDTTPPAEEPLGEEASAEDAADSASLPGDGFGEPVGPAETPEAAPVIPYVFDPLEEPAIDATPLVTAEGDDATVAASRPVILGVYESAASAEEPPEPESPAETEVEQAESDFILDLESIAGIADAPVELAPADVMGGDVSVETPIPADAAMPVDGALAEMTCRDCVYVETCPNKDQREPATCGSFQWRTA